MKQYYVAVKYNGDILTPTYGYTYTHIAYPDIDSVKKYVKENTHVDGYSIMTVSEYRRRFDSTAEFNGKDTFLHV